MGIKMNQKALPVGVDDFEKLITRDYYLVDKTMFIKELLEKKGDVNLFTRPRRFGKTLNMSMLRYFFEDGCDWMGNKVDYAHLFEGLKIMEYGDKYLQYMGSYPVISLTLKSAKQDDFSLSYTMLARAIAEEFRRHAFLMDSEKLVPYMKKRYEKLMDEEATMADYSDALKFLSECLYSHYGKKAIILVDEYDVPLESAYQYGYYDKMVSFIRSLFESAFKTNACLEFAVITGCLRISKESIFTGMNNLKIISILNKNYDEYFGFTDAEVKQLCIDYEMPQKFESVKEWYNGYVFGNANVYNPWSVILYLSDLIADINEFPSPYWANTSSNSIVRSLISHADRKTKDEIEHLIEGKTVEKQVHEDITYDEVYKGMDNLWNFMFFTGYFRKVSERMEGTKRYVTLTIPNKEVHYIFENKVLGWFEEEVEKRDLTRLYEAFINMETSIVKEEIEKMFFDTISMYDYYESFYHGFLAGILYGIGGYYVKSNREGGNGRTDLFVKPMSYEKTAFVVEFKVAKNVDELEKKADEALAQIEEKCYDRELKSEGYVSFAHYGISFFGKKCMVKVTV